MCDQLHLNEDTEYRGDQEDDELSDSDDSLNSTRSDRNEDSYNKTGVELLRNWLN